MEKYLLGIDVGTTALKAAVFSISGQLMASASQEYTLLTPQADFVEVPCDTYLNAISACIASIGRQGLIDLMQITDMAFSVQGETFCLTDENGRALTNAVVWMDRRADVQAEKMRTYFGDETCYRVTGQVSFEPCWPAPKVLWFKENCPDLFQKARKILLLEDYLIYQLTGQFVSEGSLLTSTLYWDISTKRYWPEMLEFIGVDESYFPKIIEPGQLVGKLLPHMATRLGLSKNTNVCAGCLDQAAGAIGAGNIEPGIFSENIGAALAVCVPTNKLTYDPNRQMPVHYFALPDTYMLHTFTTGGMCLRWFRDQFCQTELQIERETGLDAYMQMDLQAERISPGSDGLLTLPHLQGSMAPDMNSHAKCVFYGATLQHTKAHFIRSIMESLGYIICRNLEAISESGIEICQLRTLGGGSKSHLWNQIKADITGKPLSLIAETQNTACLGAAILAGVAGGVFPSVRDACKSMVTIQEIFTPDLEKHAVYQKQYQKYRYLFQSLSAMFDVDRD